VSAIIEEFLKRYPADGYLRYHAPRYSMVLQLAGEHRGRAKRALDIGPTRFTEMLAAVLQIRVDSLGFEADGETERGRHYHFDLNDSQHRERWRRDLEPYDLVVFSEVIEHLHTSPSLVLEFLHTIVSHGGRLVLQTPNAVALHKRVMMLLGRNPFEKIREDLHNPGHFREYTRAEIVDYARAAGFRVEKFLYGNYFDYRYASHSPTSFQLKRAYGIVNTFYSLTPSPMKAGMTFVLVKD